MSESHLTLSTLPSDRRRRRAPAVASLLAALLMSMFSMPAAVGAPATGELDQVSPRTGNIVFFSVVNNSINQLFTAGATGVLTGVDLHPDHYSHANPVNGPMKVEIFNAGSDGRPVGPVLGQGLTPPSTSREWVTAPIDSNVSVYEDQQYVFRVSVVQDTSIALAGGTYNRGRAETNGVNRSWSLAFQTYVDTSRIEPSISGTPTSEAIQGVAFTHQFTTTGLPSPTVSYSGELPPGLELSATGTLTGTPSAVGTYTFTPSVTNSVRTVPGSPVTLTVREAAVPEAPAGVTASRDSGEIVVSWSAPNPGDAPITSYAVTSSPSGATCSATTTSCTPDGLQQGSTYTFSVTATNAFGTGPAGGPSNPVLEPATPGVVSGVVGVPGDGVVELSWVAPVDDGGSLVVGYEVEWSVGGQEWQGVSTDESGVDVEGLSNGVEYVFRVRAVNVAGVGSWVEVSSTPFVFAPVFIASDGSSLEDATITPGSEIAVLGEHLPAGASVTLTMYSDQVNLGAAVIDPDGSFRIDATIAGDAEIGEHSLVATLEVDGLPAISSAISFTLAEIPTQPGSPTPQPGSPTPQPSMPDSGFSPAGWGIGTSVLLLLGAAFLACSRTRLRD